MHAFVNTLKFAFTPRPGVYGDFRLVCDNCEIDICAVSTRLCFYRVLPRVQDPMAGSLNRRVTVNSILARFVRSCDWTKVLAECHRCGGWLFLSLPFRKSGGWVKNSMKVTRANVISENAIAHDKQATTTTKERKKEKSAVHSSDAFFFPAACRHLPMQ